MGPGLVVILVTGFNIPQGPQKYSLVVQVQSTVTRLASYASMCCCCDNGFGTQTTCAAAGQLQWHTAKHLQPSLAWGDQP